MTETVKPVARWHYGEAAWMRYSTRTTQEVLKPCGWCGKEAWVNRQSRRCRGCTEKIHGPWHFIRQRAHRLVSRAIARGELPRLSAVEVPCADGCGNRAKVYDHRDYRKPLEVEPVCVRCNILRGAARDVAHLWRKAPLKWQR